MALGSPKKRKASMMPAILSGLLVVLVVGWAAYQAFDYIMMRKESVGLSDVLTSPDTCKDPAVAYKAMQRLVLRQIPAPRAAQFAPRETALTRPGGAECDFVFTSFVNTQNTYGGTTRTDFIAEVAYDFSRGGWRLAQFEQRRR